MKQRCWPHLIISNPWTAPLRQALDNDYRSDKSVLAAAIQASLDFDRENGPGQPEFEPEDDQVGGQASEQDPGELGKPPNTS